MCVCVCLCSTRHTVRFACGARVRACVCAYNVCWCACEILRPHPKTILLANYRGTKTHLLHGNLVQLCAFAISCAAEGVCENWARNKLRAVFFMFGRKLRASERAPLEAPAEIIAVNNNIFIFMCWRAKTGTKTAPENYCFSQANTHTRARAEKAAMKCIFSQQQLSANVHRHSLRLDLFPALRAHVFRFQ